MYNVIVQCNSALSIWKNCMTILIDAGDTEQGNVLVNSLIKKPLEKNFLNLPKTTANTILNSKRLNALLP